MASCLFTIATAQTEVTTKFIKNSSLESGFTGWSNVGMQLQTNTDFKVKAATAYAEKWVEKGKAVGNASLTQQLNNLPAGKYQLVVAAQNLNQNAVNTQCAGAYIFAGEERTSVYTPNDYSVDFTTYSGSLEIGFMAENAKGNWLAVDNFRLYQVGEIETTQFLDSLKSLVAIAKDLMNEFRNESNLNLQSAIQEAEALTTESEISEIQSVFCRLTEAIEKARFAILLENATPGSGTAPKVTKTVKFVATGATQALMRATMTGSNILERGVCWSTEHEPTVLDNRTTENFSLNGYIFHIRNLKPSTVYYLRPYVMNKTYTVAYGEEVKIVTHKTGNCIGTWDNGAPSEEANMRCRNAIQETINYFNEWTGINGFTLSGHYGAQTQTADCSYGGWMRIGPNAGNQAIGTVIHETGHGVGVGTSARWADKNFHDWKWKGRTTNEALQFLENRIDDANCYFVGDEKHGWGQSATYDWFVNGADKDTHTELQYIGGCVLLHSLFIDGLCPTSSYTNGLAGYTYNFDDSTKYYLMCKDANRGLGIGLLESQNSYGMYRGKILDCMNNDDPLPISAAWYLEFDPSTSCYRFRSAADGKYLSHSQTISVSKKTTPGTTELFQLMPDRTDVTLTDADKKKSLKTHGYWLTWNNSGYKAMAANAKKYDGIAEIVELDITDAATMQQWIILSEEEVLSIKGASAVGIQQLPSEEERNDLNFYDIQGRRIENKSGLIVNNGKIILVR